MLKTITFIVFLVGGFQYFMQFRKWLDWDRPIFNHKPGPCRSVGPGHGSEDLTHIGNGLFLVSSGFSLDAHIGVIKMLDLSRTEPDLYVLNITNPPADRHFMAGPHGLATWRDQKTGVLTLFVVTHPPHQDRIEVFNLVGVRALRHIRTITDPLFRFMNDLVPVGPEQFYITKFWTSRDRLKIYLDFMMNLGEVHFYDGNRARVVDKGLHLPNGINISPDGNTVYVVDCTAKTLYGYRRDVISNGLTRVWEHDMETLIDNIEVDPNTGDLWIGCHPKLYTRLDLFNIFNFVHPSQVIKVKMVGGMVSDVTEVYMDDGREIMGASIASEYNGRLVIGSVDEKLVVCDIK